MTAATYDQLLATLRRIVRAHYAEPESGADVPAILDEFESAMAIAADMVGHDRDDEPRSPARRLPAPTGQPVEPDPDSRPPAHAGSPKRTPSTLTPLT